MSATVLRRRRARAYTLVPASTTAPTLYAFAQSGGTSYAWLYNGTSWQSDRASTTSLGSPDPGEQPVLIHSDVDVGDGALIIPGMDGETLEVWSPDNDQVYAYGDGSWLNAGAAYIDGALWWPEVEPADSPSGTRIFRLVSSPADLSDPQQISTHTATLPTGYVFVQVERAWLTNTAAYLEVGFETESNPEVYDVRRVRLPLNGSSASEVDLSSLSTVTWAAGKIGLPVLTRSLAIGTDSGQPRLLAFDDGLSEQGGVLWPSSWSLSYGNLGLSPDLERASIYGLVSGVPTYAEAPPEGPYSTAPDVLLEIEDHPTVGAPPDWVYPQ